MYESTQKTFKALIKVPSFASNVMPMCIFVHCANVFASSAMKINNAFQGWSKL